MYTHVLFQHDDIYIDYQNHSYSVRAKNDIRKGTLVLVEHVVSGSFNTVVGSVTADDALLKSLYPRREGSDALEKTCMNSFFFKPNYVIGNFFSKFNHSCIPVCHMDIADKVLLSKAINVAIYGMWTHRDVKAGGELTIDYVNGNGIEDHDRSEERRVGKEC